MKRILYTVIVLLVFTNIMVAQLGVGTEAPNSSSQLEVVSADRGILIPRIELESTTDQSTIRNGNVNSLMVFNTQTVNDVSPGYYYWYVDKWYKLATTAGEIITTLIDNENGTYLYTSEDGTQTLIDIPTSVVNDIINQGDVYTEIINLIDTNETVTIIENHGNGTYTYYNENEVDASGTIVGSGVTINVVGDVLTNIQNQGDIYDEIINILVAESDIFVDNGDGTFTHTTVDGDVQTFDANTTTMVNNGDGTYTFTNANGDTITVDVIGDVVTNNQNQGDIYDEIINILVAESDIFVDNGDGTFTHTTVDGDVQTFDANTTTMVNNGDGTYTFTNANGDTITVDVIGDVVTNIQNQGDIYDEIINILVAESDIFVDNGDGTFTHTTVDGDVQTFDANTTTMVNNGDGTYTFTNANGDTITVDVIGDVVTNIQNGGDIYNEIINLIDLNETITTIVDNGDGTITYTNEAGAIVIIDLAAGPKGDDGDTPTIGANGNREIGGDDTGITAKGTKGDKGDKGDHGDDGDTPTIGANGNWEIGGVDTGIAATGQKGDKGDDGDTPTIGANGNWEIGGVDTGIAATGPKGDKGDDGADGVDGNSITDVEIVNGELIVTIFDPVANASTPHNLGNVAGVDGVDGKSIEDVTTTDVFDPITNDLIGTEITFLDGNNDPVGNPFTVLHGKDGVDGLSAYEIWEQLPGNDGKSEQDFIDSLKGEDGQDGQDGVDGKSITDVEIVDGELIVTVYDPATDTSTPENLGNVEGADGEDGKSITGVSTADALDPITNEVIGTEITFLDEDNTPVGAPVTVLNGVDGEDGLSAYEIWEQLPGNDGKSEQDFIDSLKGEDGQDGLDGKSITEVKIVDGELIVTVYDPETDTSTPENLGNVEGADGEDGKSITGVSTADALDPITNEVIGTEITFLDEDNNPVGSPVTVLNGVDGENGEDGLSAYEIWEQLPGNDGKSEQDFIDSLKGEDGQDGQDGLDGKSITDVEIVNGELIVTVYDPETNNATDENL